MTDPLSGTLTALGTVSPVSRILAVFAVALYLWLRKPVPYVVSSLLAVAALPLLGLTESMSAAFSGFASPLVMFLLILFLLGEAIGNVGLDEWVAQRLLHRAQTQGGAYGGLAVAVLTTAAVMPSATARAATFAPIVERLGEQVGTGDGDGFARAGLGLLGHANPVASMGLMTGGGMALVTARIVAERVQPISWGEWAIAMVPPVLFLYLLSTAAIGALGGIVSATPDTRGESETETETETASESTAPLTREQGVVAIVMGGTLLAWVGGSFVGLPAIIPGLFAVALLSLPGVDVLGAEDIAGVSWGVLFLIGATLSVLDVMRAVGAVSTVVAELTAAVPLESLPGWQLVGFLLALAIVVRIGFSTATAAIVVVLPVILGFSGALGVNRLFVSLSVLLVVGSTTVFPFNTTAALVVLEREALETRDVLQYGLITMSCSLLVVALAWHLYWPLLF